MGFGLGFGFGFSRQQGQAGQVSKKRPEISIASLGQAAATTGFNTESIERVARLFELLEGLFRHTYLKTRLVLKGGTALNLFAFDVPRLSVDIDLNYIGAVDRETMLNEKPSLEAAIEAVCKSMKLEVKNKPTEYAGGKWRLNYVRATGRRAELQLDLNFMHRATLWDPVIGGSKKVGDFGAEGIPVLDTHELAAGKLAALFGRTASRDLFDVRNLLDDKTLVPEKLRLAFVVYGAMSTDCDWRTITPDSIRSDSAEIQHNLIPLLRNMPTMSKGELKEWADQLVDSCHKFVATLLPFSDNERNFLTQLIDHGTVAPELVTEDERIRNIIQTHPALQWAIKVRADRKTRENQTNGS